MIIKEKSGLRFELSKEDFTAKVISSKTTKEDIFIPSFVNYLSQKYRITKIGKDSFKNNTIIKSINFPEDSEVNSIETDAFMGSSIMKLYIPPSLEELNEGWCRYTKKLTKITVSPNNKRFLLSDNQMIIGKSDPNSDNYDILYYAPRNIREAIIPSNIKYINSYAFANCFFLTTINFPSNSKIEKIGGYAFFNTRIERITIPDQVKVIKNGAFYNCTHLRQIDISKDSQLQCIEENAFNNSKIESIFIPSKLESLQEGWCCNIASLFNIYISEENDRFSLFENNMIVYKSELTSDKYDVLCFASRSILDAHIPSTIKYICPYTFSNSKIQTIEFSDDSEIEVINKETFSYSDITEVRFPKSVKIIGEGTFLNCKYLHKIEFPENSELQIIESKAFCNSSIHSFNIPSKFVEFRGKWCCLTPFLNEISISPNNRRFGLLDEKIIIGKSETNDDDFDSIVFASRDIMKAVIPSNIKYINQFAFNGCKILEKVEIRRNSKLESIESNAFSYSSIKNIYIPRHVLRIGRRAFDNSSLESIQISKKSELQYIAKFAFKSTPIKSISIPDTVTTINDSAFEYCSSLQSVDLSDESELSTIGKSAFSQTLIKQIKIPKNVEIISELAFGFCNSLDRVEFAEDSELKCICNGAFDSTSISSLFIPSKVKMLQKGWCKNTRYLNNIIVSPNNKYFIDLNGQILVRKSDLKSESYDNLYFVARNIKLFVLPSFITHINSYAFDRCDTIVSFKIENNSKLESIQENSFSHSFYVNLKNYKIPEESKIYEICKPYNDLYNQQKYYYNELIDFNITPTTTVIDEGTFKYCSFYTKINISPENECFKYIDEKMLVGKSNIKQNEYDILYYVSQNIVEITIPSYITKIESYAFYRHGNLQRIEFESNSKLEIISKFAFSYSGIKSISIPDHVRIIDDDAFKDCYELTSIQFSNKSELRYLGAYAFHNSSKLNEITIPNNVEHIYQSTFYNCESLTKIIFEKDSKLKSIQSNALFNTSITQLYLPSHLNELSIDWNASVTKLKKISVSPKNDNFKMLNDEILIGKTNHNSDIYDAIYFASRDIEFASIPSYIKRINKEAFANCNKLKEVEFEENSELEIIDERAFECSSITEIQIPKSVKIIQKCAFQSSSIEKIKIPSQITEICIGTFKYSQLKQIEFENDSKLLLIDYNAFNLSKIESILIPLNVQIIETETFINCSRLKNVSFEENSKLHSIKYAAFLNTPIKVFKFPDSIESIDYLFNSNNNSIESIEFSENSKLTQIGESIIRYTNIKNLYIPPKVAIIDEEAFKNATKLKKIKVSPKNKHFKDIDGKMLVGKSDINNNDYDILYFVSPDIDEIIIPSYITKINPYVFNNFNNLQQVEFESNSKLEIIGKYAFSNTSIETISIPDHVRFIDEDAFDNCQNLENVIFSKKSELKIIGKYSFGHTLIERIVIPKSVEYIYERAFTDNRNLVSVEFEENSELKSLGPFVFSNTKIKSLQIPSKVKNLEKGWCRFMTKLNKVTVSPNNKDYVDVCGKFVYGKSDENKDDFDVLCFASRLIEKVIIQSNIKRIDSYAFSDCCNIESLLFENDSNLETICNESFSFSSIKYLDIPKSVKIIESNAFFHCENIRFCIIDENSNISIQPSAFNDSSLSSLILPKGVNEMIRFNGSSSIYSIEFLCDDLIFFNLDDCNQNISLISFPNAIKVEIYSNMNYYHNLLIFIPPMTQINSIHNDFN